MATKPAVGRKPVIRGEKAKAEAATPAACGCGCGAKRTEKK
jgi:hypothetical protein